MIPPTMCHPYYGHLVGQRQARTLSSGGTPGLLLYRLGPGQGTRGRTSVLYCMLWRGELLPEEPFAFVSPGVSAELRQMWS